MAKNNGDKGNFKKKNQWLAGLVGGVGNDVIILDSVAVALLK